MVELGGKGNIQSIQQALESRNIRTHDWNFPSVSEYTTLWELHGVEVQFARLYDRPTLLPEGIDSWIQMFVGKIDPDVLETVVADLQRTLFDGTNWTADYRRLCISGRKRSV